MVNPIANSIAIAETLPPQSVTASGGGKSISLVGYDSLVHILHSSAATAGTNPELDVTLQVSDSPIRVVNGAAGDVGEAYLVLRNGTNDNTELGVTFTADGDISVQRVLVYLKRTGTISSGDVWLQIQGDDTGPDDSSIGQSRKVSASSIGTTGEWVEFIFDTPVDLVDEDDYWIVLQGDYTLSSSNHISLGVDTVGSGGDVSIHDSDWGSVVTTQAGNVQVYALEFEDITGAEHGTVSTSAVLDEVSVNCRVLSGTVLRPYFTIDGTNSPAFTVAAHAVLGNAKDYPI